ncbi:MAG: helix-turn-helix transcriptional regulator [Burkholderiales bacterium]|nr:helix-turn-helix transcriptional regulator [Burkholderiales bacterium]
MLTTHQLVYRFEGFELRPGRELLRDGSPVAIGGTALELLRLLVAARGGLVTKDELFAALWSDVVVVENTLHQHAAALRKALGERAGLIATVPRRGYRFAGTVEEAMVDSGPAADALGPPPVLPSPLTPLIGRAAEVATVEGLLRAGRCVTLLGPGGIGKTRLAVEIAQRRRAAGDAAVHLVELASLAEGGHVAATIAASLGLSGPSGVPPPTRIRHALREAPALLVVDNCEHLIEATAALLRELLEACPSLRILATSQRPLGIPGEQRVQVPMLGLPPAGTSDTSLLAASSAVRLLLARVGDCDPRLAFDATDLQTAAELCRQLDGNALAIELAAVRVATLGLAAVSGGLADRFELLAGPQRGSLPKHQTLHSLIDWSHDLLSDGQRAVFRRVSVFSGGWTIESAKAVVGDATAPGAEVGRRLAELVEWSLVGRDASTQSPRFRMLETQRAYAREKLRASGEEARLADAHARHLCSLFETGYGEWDSTPDEVWIARFGPERDNLTTALRTAIDARDPALATRLVGASMWLWRAAGAIHEFQQILEEPLLHSLPERPDPPTARLLLARAYALHATSSDSQRIKEAAERAVAAFADTPDRLGAANAMLCLASAFAQLGDTAAHRACLARVEAVLAGQRSGKTFAWYCGSHAWAAQLAGEPHEALAWAIRSRAAYRGSGGWHGETRAMLHIADLKLALGDVEGAITIGNESVERLRDGSHRVDLGRALANLGAAWFARGELAVARSCWAQALEELQGLDFTYWVFDHIALLAIAEARDDVAARLLGYAEAGYARLNKGRRVQNEQRSRQRALDHLASRYSAEALAILMLEGASASEEEAIAAALPARPDPPPVRRPLIPPARARPAGTHRPRRSRAANRSGPTRRRGPPRD